MESRRMAVDTATDAATAASGTAMAIFKSAPPVAVTGLSMVGVPLQDWVYVLTLIWLACQIAGWVIDRLKRWLNETDR